MKAPSGPEDILPAPAEWWAELLGQKASTYGGPPLSAPHFELRVCAYMCRRVRAWEPMQQLLFFSIFFIFPILCTGLHPFVRI